MKHYTLDSLIDKAKSDVMDKWHREGRAGNDGSAGNTLEDLLGVEENNLKLPDWGEIEIKTKKREAQSLITLLHREPLPPASIPKLILSLGWRHKEAGKKHPDDEMSFRSTTRANHFSGRGFSIKLTKSKVTFIFDPHQVNVQTIDKTGAFSTYGDWLADVKARQVHYSNVLPVYWEKQYILDEIKAKLNNTLFFIVKRKKIDGVTHFKYESATLFSGFNASKFDVLFKEQSLYVDFDARTRHNHGTKFRIDVKAIGKLFDKTVQIFG